MRTLVIHTGGIGDFLLACPAIAGLAASGPVELAGHFDRVSLAVMGGIAEQAHGLDAIAFHTVFTEPSPTLRTFVARFDRIVVWMRDEDGAIERGLCACRVDEVHVYPGLPDADWRGHASDYYLACLGMPRTAPWRLAIPDLGEPLDVVIHPGSGSAKKNWPLNRFCAVAAHLQREGRRVTWCLGPAELERGGIADALYRYGEVLHSEDSPVELARRLAGARAYLGNDSGITHLAAALGVPTLAVFGPTHPQVWAPRGKHVHVVRDVPWPDVEEVLSAVQRAASATAAVFGGADSNSAMLPVTSTRSVSS